MGNLGNRSVQCVNYTDGYETADWKVKKRLWHEKKNGKENLTFKWKRIRKGKMVSIKMNVFYPKDSYPFGLQPDVGQCFPLANFLFHK